MPGCYEFTEAQNATFKKLVANMRRAGITVVVGAILFLVFHAADYFGLSIAASPVSHILVTINYGLWGLMGIIGCLIGILVLRATGGFTRVVTTEGNDIEHLLEGIRQFATILGVVFWAALVVVLLLGLSLAFLLMSGG